MRSSYKSLGKYIRQAKLRNRDLSLTKPMGINIAKFFMPSVANTKGTDLSKYRVVKEGQFAYNPMHVGRDEVLPIALLKGESAIIVSPAYVVFEIIDQKVLMPEYLMMWFRRKDFDRNAWFTTDSSVRGGFSWESFCEMELPIPSPEKQQEIVDEYNTVVNRIKLNEELNQNLEETAQTLYRHWFVDFEFPITKEYAEAIGKPELEGQPYKSSGGEMVFDEELDKEVPYHWKVKKLGEISAIGAGGDRPKMFSSVRTEECNIPIFSNGITKDGLYGYTNKASYKKNSITVSARGTIGFSMLRSEDFQAIVRLLVVKPHYDEAAIYLWQSFKQTLFDDSGSVQNQLTKPQISKSQFVYPSKDILKEYHLKLKPLYDNTNQTAKISEKCSDLISIILSRMAAYKKLMPNEVY